MYQSGHEANYSNVEQLLDEKNIFMDIQWSNPASGEEDESQKAALNEYDGCEHLHII